MDDPDHSETAEHPLSYDTLGGLELESITHHFILPATSFKMESILTLHSRKPARIDTLRSADASVALQVAGIVGFALLTAMGSQVRIYVWEIPFTLQTLAVYGSGLYLGARNGLLSQLLYLSIGLFLPVYAGSEYGATFFVTGLTAGYILGFPVAAFVSGLVSSRWNGTTGSVLSLVAGSIVLFSIGVTWFHYGAGHATWFESVDKGWLRFAGIDLAKILFIALVYSGSRRITTR